jgi:hypothetical protein
MFLFSSTPLSIGKLRHQAFGFRHSRREKLQQTCRPDRRLQARALIELKQAGGKMEPPGIRENMLEHKPRDPVRLDADELSRHAYLPSSARNERRMDTRSRKRGNQGIGTCAR